MSSEPTLRCVFAECASVFSCLTDKNGQIEHGVVLRLLLRVHQQLHAYSQWRICDAGAHEHTLHCTHTLRGRPHSGDNDDA